MTRKEKTYSALVIVVALLVFGSCAQFYFILIPKMKNPGFMRYIVFILGLEGLTLLSTAIANLIRGKLSQVATVIQSIFLVLMFPIGTPLGIWGFYLLRKQQAEKKAQAER